MNGEMIVLFDGLCNLCETSVLFIMRHDKKGRFKFARLQSETGARLLDAAGMKKDRSDTLVLVRNGTTFTKSTAALEIARGLDWPWRMAYPLIIVPRQLRDAAYSFIAKNRYRWFGKKDRCALPSGDMKKRFVE